MIYPTSREHLFSQGHLRDFLDGRVAQAKAEVEAIPAHRLIGADVAVLATEIRQQFALQVPTVRWEDPSRSDGREVDLDVSGEPGRAGFGRGHPLITRGVEITVVVPFEGDPDLFYYHPNRYGAGPPRASVRRQELHFGYAASRFDDEAQRALKTQIEDDRRVLVGLLAGVAHDVGVYYENLQREVTQAIDSRNRRLKQSDALLTNLGIPMRRRPESERPREIPLTRRRVSAELVNAGPGKPKSDPVLAMQEYEYILGVVANLGLAMERSPSTFRNLKEPELRDLFLVLLNGHYEGAALGEVFNGAGKTDILIRVGNSNVFVAECKFWDGPQSVKDALDQLLGYATWRDTKTALILFNQRKDFSSVLTKLQDAVQTHAQFQRALVHQGETHFRYLFRHPNDRQRDVYVAVLAFDVPVTDAHEGKSCIQG